uniref:Uncharacterized protein n=1 Tax=Rhizophora mucronata TaxID=61149 RepID=A0A2P2NDH2_RHIMU
MRYHIVDFFFLHGYDFSMFYKTGVAFNGCFRLTHFIVLVYEKEKGKKFPSCCCFESRIWKKMRLFV